MIDLLKTGDKVAITVNGRDFHEAEFIEKIINPNTGHIVNKVKVKLSTHEFFDYFIDLHPVDKINEPVKIKS